MVKTHTGDNSESEAHSFYIIKLPDLNDDM